MSFVDQLIYKLDKEAQYGNKDVIKKHKKLISLCLEGTKTLKVSAVNKFCIKDTEENLKKYHCIYKAFGEDKVHLDYYIIYKNHEKDIKVFVNYYERLLKLKNLYPILETFKKYTND